MRSVQVLDSDWFKRDLRAVLAVLSLKAKMRYTVRNWCEHAWFEARRILAKSGRRDVDRLEEIGM